MRYFTNRKKVVLHWYHTKQYSLLQVRKITSTNQTEKGAPGDCLHSNVTPKNNIKG